MGIMALVEAVPWEYKVLTFQNTEIDKIEAVLGEWGKAGWELVTLSTTVKHFAAVNTNTLVGVLKRPGVGEADRALVPQRSENAGWI